MDAMLKTPALFARNQVRPTSSTTAMSREGLGIGRVRAECGWPKIVASVEAIRELRDDWDGDGAEAPPSDVIDTVREMLVYLRDVGLPCPTTTGAGPNGTVLLAWERGGRYFEIDVVGFGKVEWFRSKPGAKPVGGETIDLAIRALIEWVQV